MGAPRRGAPAGAAGPRPGAGAAGRRPAPRDALRGSWHAGRLLVLLVLLGALGAARASHFRYGTISWAPTGTVIGNNADVEVRPRQPTP